MTERQVEAYLIKQVKAKGGIALKWVSPGRAGVPDRILLMPNGRVLFAEVKSSIGKLSALQKTFIRTLEGLGFVIGVLNSCEQVDEFLEGL